MLERTDYSIGIASIHPIFLLVLFIMSAVIVCMFRNFESNAFNLLIQERTSMIQEGKLRLYTKESSSTSCIESVSRLRSTSLCDITGEDGKHAYEFGLGMSNVQLL